MTTSSDQPKNTPEKWRESIEKLSAASAEAGFWKVDPPQCRREHTELAITIFGRALVSAGPDTDQFRFSTQQELKLIVPNSSQREPYIVIEGPVCHPNLSADGEIHAVDLQFQFANPPCLLSLVERTWDALRCEWFDLSNALQNGIARWFQTRIQADPDFFPIDPRCIRQTGQKNIFRYRRKGEAWRTFQSDRKLVIDESSTAEFDTPDSPQFFITDGS